MGEQRGSVIQSGEGLENEGIRGRGGLYVAREGEIEGVDDHRIRDDGGICIVSSGIQVILPRESICGSHLCTRGYFPDNIEILEEEGPACLSTRQFARVLEVGQVLMVSKDRDRMLLHGLHNQISSSAHSGVVRGHIELFRHLVLSLVVTRSRQDLSHTRGSKEGLDYWQVKHRTS